jgi:multiple sugar transport system permease protein
MSFTNWSVLRKAIDFVGIENYVRFFQSPYSYKVMGNTLIFSGGVVVLNLILATSLALLLQRKIFGVGFFRLAVFTPILTTVVVWAIVWQLLLASNGFVNQLLQLFNVEGPAWLFNTRTAMPAVIVVMVLKGVGMNMFIVLAALQNVPDTYYEAARMEGSSRWNTFSRITLPLISGTLFACAVITMIASFKSFGLIYVLTNGGPLNSTAVWSFEIYVKAFQSLKIGEASASATLMFVALVVLTLIQWKIEGRWNQNDA